MRPLKWPPLQLVLVSALVLLMHLHSIAAQVLNPPYFNLAESRKITATATCGEGIPESKEVYCKLVGANWLDRNENVDLIEGQACDYCDPRDPVQSHPAANAIDGTEKWWQSPPLSRGLQYSNVSLTIDLGQEFHVAYVFIKMGNSPRPGVWVLERSRDGETFTPWQYFADTPVDCIQYFGKLSTQPITRDDSVICETKFSKLVPLEGGEIAVSLLNGRPSSDNFSMSATLQEWSTATKIRLQFIRPKTTLGHLLSVMQQDPSVTRRYFYSIKDIHIGGKCVCNGHASQCDQSSPDDPYKVSCSCQHNTCGSQCDTCCPGYHQYEWSRATLDNPFVCEKCNCNGHSEDCYFNATVAEKRLSTNIHGNQRGGGVCRNCQHHTTGINCDQCEDGYYRPAGTSIDAIDVCQPCQCNRRFSTGKCFTGTGICECKPNYQEPDCDKCSYGYYDFPTCKECDCFRNGTAGNICELTTGQCPCLEGYGGTFCKECSPNYFGYPKCQGCACNKEHSIDNNCNSTSGQCQCKTNYGGRQCNQCSVGFYNYPRCQSCQCDPVGTTDEVCDPSTGACFCKQGYAGSSCNQCAPGYYNYPNCTKCDCSPEGSTGSTCSGVHGKCECKFNYGGTKCNDCSPGYYNFPKCVPCNCNWRGARDRAQSCDHSGNCICKDNFEGQKCDKCKEGYYNYPYCEECNCNPAGLVAEFGGCDKVEEGKLCECKLQVKGRICNQCKDLHWNLQMNNRDGCESCLCNQNGTISRIGLCDSDSGQCMCRPNVQGRQCDQCRRNTYLLQSSNLFGCIDCNCDIGGSISTECDRLTGQCRCKPRIKGLSCSQTIEGNYFPTLYQFQYEAEDWINPTGSPARFGYDEALFPGYSWRGYATFNPLQREILTNISISKFSIYRVIVNYVNLNSETVNGVLTFTANEWMGEEEQTVNIAFEPAKEPRQLLVTGKSLASRTVTLVAGPWKASLKADKSDLFVDYIVLLPQPYYDQSLFLDKRSVPCALDTPATTTCIKYAYPEYSETSKTISAAESLTLDGGAERKPPITNELIRDKLDYVIPPVRMDSKTTNLLFDLKAPENGTYLLVLNYHTPANSNASTDLDIELLLNSDKNITLSSANILTACPYSFICRQIITQPDGQILTLENLLKDEKVRLKLELAGAAVDDLHFNVHSVTLVPFVDRWPFDLVKPKLACVFKGSKCAQLSFPQTEGFKIEAESESSRERVVEEPLYNHGMVNGGGKRPLLVRVDNPNGSSQAFEVRGTVPEKGEYSFVLHYYQPKRTGFVAETSIHGDGDYRSSFATIEHCPNMAGCRVVLQTRDTNSSFFTIQKNFEIKLQTPPDAELFLDYLYVIPGNQFKESVLQLASTDVGTNLMTADCLASNYYIDPEKANEFCRASIFSIAVDFNGGALPCQCNIYGSFDHKCKSFGGQCNCKPNVIGRDCTMCRTGYYGFPNCRKCNCPSTAVCDAKSGQCVCPKGVTGELCDTCLPLTFGFDRLIGCVDCGCNSHGVVDRSNLTCHLETGQCHCKRNVVGRTCDKCKAGFFSFPGCQLCRCDIRGSTPEICDQRSSSCYCKKNVYGEMCDRCKDDSYYLEEGNKEGCTKCFCFGTTDRCTSSQLSVVSVRSRTSTANQDNWQIYNLTVTENLIEKRLLLKNDDYGIDFGADKIVVTTNVLREVTVKEMEFDSSLYIALPKEFLGNKITSYGGRFQYRVINKSNKGEDYVSVVSPDVILIAPNISIIHQQDVQPNVNEEYLVSFNILPREFKHLDGSSISREKLMMTLVRLEAVYVRIKYFDPTTEIVLHDMAMDTASTSMKGQMLSSSNQTKALSVERCNCPPNYKGTSCEECAEGYYRIKLGPYLGACVPCNCNGHSNQCDPVTGRCFSCKYNTEGDHCERCVEGYHGDATRGTPHDCIICACPLPIASNNFATSCEVSPSGSVLNCNCKEGYNGTRCDMCAAGHFGYPSQAGRSCHRCECNGNIDASDIGACDAVNGTCLKCLNNASGEKCERCAQWFHGDSITVKNCTACSCNQCGSEYCDHLNGECKCQPNVVGTLCDQCAPGHFGFQGCTGCRPCKCADAAIGHDCDEEGQCKCKPGASGKHCETCLAGYWGYTKFGCTSCKCNEKFSRATQCNLFTGQCQCLPGVVGEKCEKCPDRWVLVPDSGCQECGNCVHVLLNDTDDLQVMMHPIQNDVLGMSSSVLYYRKLNHMKSEMAKYDQKLKETFNQTLERTKRLAAFAKVKSDLNELSGGIEKLDFKFDAVEKNLNKTNQRALTIHNDSMILENEVKGVKLFTAQVIENINTIVAGFQNSTNEKENEDKKKESERTVEDIANFNFKKYQESMRIEMFNQTLEKSLEFIRPSNQLNLDIVVLSDKFANMSVLVAEMKNLTQKSREDTIDAERIFKSPLKRQIEGMITEIDANLELTTNHSKEARSLLDERAAVFDQLKDQMTVDLTQQKEKLSGSMERLRLAMDVMNREIPDTQREVAQAMEHAASSKEQSESLRTLFASTKTVATDPLRAANAYNNISAAVDEGEKAVAWLNNRIVEPAKLLDAGLTTEVRNLNSELTKTEYRLKELTINLNDQAETIGEIGSSADDRLARFTEMKTAIDQIEITNIDGTRFDDISRLVKNVTALDKNVTDLDNMINLMRNRTRGLTDYTAFSNEVNEARDYIKRFNDTTGGELSDPRLLEERQATFRRQKESIGDQIGELKKRISIAKHLANNIRIAAKFSRESVLELNSPPNLPESSTYTKFSLQFIADEPDGLLAYIGEAKPSRVMGAKKKRQVGNDLEYMCLEIRSGRVMLTWDLGSNQPNEILDDQYVYDKKWHTVTVERFGKLVKLTVKSDDRTTEKKDLTDGSKSIFNFYPGRSHIYVGGVSPNVRISSNVGSSHFVGTISNVIYDNQPMGLWNLKEVAKVEGSAVNELTTENSLRFNGNSYVVLEKPTAETFKENVFVVFSFKTFTKNGLLMLVGDSVGKEFQSIELDSGHVVLRYDLGSALTTVVSEGTYNDGKWHIVKVSREAKEGSLTVDTDDEKMSFAIGLESSLTADENVYLGGYPGLHPYFDATKEGFDGCIKDLQIDSGTINLNKNKASFGVTSGCSHDIVRTVSFTDSLEQAEAGSFVQHTIKPETLEAAGPGNLQIAFKFHTLSNNGLLVMLASEAGDLFYSVSLADGMIVLRNSAGESRQTISRVFNDNQWHYVTCELSAAAGNNTMRMDIDDTYSYLIESKLTIQTELLTTLHVGGVRADLRDSFRSAFGDFTGCIGDVTINEAYMNMVDAVDKRNAQFTRCHLAKGEGESGYYSGLPYLGSKLGGVEGDKAVMTRRPAHRQLPPIGSCKLPPIPRAATLAEGETDVLRAKEVRFGDGLWSRYEFSISNDVSKSIENAIGFSIEFKTVQANGILFYITSANSIDFIGLYFVNGKLHYGFDCGSGRGVVALEGKKYNDGQWHKVRFSRKDNRGRLDVDDIDSAEFTSTGPTTSLNVRSPMYVGGVPEELASQVKSHLKSSDKTDYSYALSSFAGCLRKLTMREVEYEFINGRPINVAPCSDQVEPGNFFHYEGGHIRLAEEFRVRVEFTLKIMVKPRKPDGILAVVFGKTDFLALYLHKGKVVFTVENGAGPITATSTNIGEDSLCNGKWHTIEVLKNKNIVTLNVDEETQLGMGQAGISSTDTKDPLFIGGLPDKMKEEKKRFLNGVADDYLGCLRILEMNGQPISLSNVKLEGLITLNSCPVD